MLLKTEDVARMLNVSAARVYELAREGIVPSVRLGRSVRFDKEKIREFIATGGQALPGGWKKEA